MRYLTLIAIALLLIAACTTEPAASETPTPTLPPAVTQTPTAAPSPEPSPTPTATLTPTPTFSAGQVILPTPVSRTPTPTPVSSLERQLRTIESRISILRSLFALRPIQREFITSADLRELLEEDLQDDRDAIEESKALFVTMGILESGVDFDNLLVDLYSETVLGFYDTEEEKMYLIENDDEFGPNDALTYSHEYIHSLQQQHYDIKTIRESLKEQGDKGLAFQAVVEGDATLSETLYVFQHLSEEEQNQVRAIVAETDTAAYDAAPYLMQRLIAFPYVEGTSFLVSAFLTAGGTWDIVDSLYENLPQSTEQILHPNKYGSQEPPIEVELPDISPALGEGWTELYRDTFGEFLLLAYMETWIAQQDAFTASTGWGGDTYSFLRHSNGSDLLIMSMEWDTEADAQEFYDVFSGAMTFRTEIDWISESEETTAQTLSLENQVMFIDLNGAKTLVVYAPDNETLSAARAALQAEE